jgi:hypothetical protein
MKLLKQITTWVSIIAVVGACVAVTVIFVKPVKAETPTEVINGIDGQNGLSAYEIAVANGFVGTEAEWLASLHGADGQDGTDGVNGQKGDKGDKGDTGPQGEPGAAADIGGIIQYVHAVTIFKNGAKGTSAYSITFTIINSSAAQFNTFESVRSYFYDAGFISSNLPYSASGFIAQSSVNYVVNGIYVTVDSLIFKVLNLTAVDSTVLSFTADDNFRYYDKVIQIVEGAV